MEGIKKEKHGTVALLENLCEQTIRKTIAIRVWSLDLEPWSSGAIFIWRASPVV